AAITKAEHNSYQLAVMFIDLDRFKLISDTLGHQVGDRLLKDIVQRLIACLQEEDLITRWGRDEFTILVPKVDNPESVSAIIAQRILTALKSPFTIDNKPVYVNSHIGIAIYPEHGTDAETLLKNADSALSQAQDLNHDYQYYDPAFASKIQQLLTLENFLHSALQHNEFLVYYQPIVNIITGKIVKMEALLRWHNPQLGLVAPNIFIPLAEKNGSIIPIGEWVLKTACAQNKTWQQMGLTPIKISVNLSVRQFQQPNLVTVIGNILQQTQLSPSSLELEITESVTMQNTELAKTILKQLHEMGISLSMDDFGTGYSSLSYLKQFPFCTLKIDRSFVKDLPTSAEDIAIVDAVLTLGQGLNLNVVAEGVETEELKELLKN
ncbi:MAG: putative bifunctional diguanylate cyclase/phosphodiesterase, partial [Waterburya sp.]